MRAFKFRAWDKIDNRMRYQNDVEGIKEWPSLLAVGFHGLPICIDNDSFKDDEIVGWNRDHNLLLMQYTGLNDKNDKEIYEGDIVTYNGGETESRAKMEVKWCDGCYQLKAYKEDWCYELGECLQDSLDIVGNIYENPELNKEASE